MNRLAYYTSSFFLFLLSAAVTAFAQAQPASTDFQMAVEIDPVTGILDVRADVTLAEDYAGKTIEFLLTDAVEIISAEPAVVRLPYDGSGGFTGINGSSVSLTEKGIIARYRVTLGKDQAALRIHYRGAVNFPLGDPREQYTRGFRSTAGIISEEGIYLAGSSLWYPYFSDELLTFRLRSNVPEDWHLISQGNGQSRDPDGMAEWDSAGAVDEIYLVGGPLQRYAEAAGAVAAEVYLRTPDDALAQKYLTATAQYIEMYRALIGPYPYGKFALVENFWETGYGMPSFTLLGSQIIRFPFILTSSYPHEILHNWWGNSVFVDYTTGNWCEGLTAYMADHLMQELRGTGADWRRDTLKKYRDFVNEGLDFPLTEFRSRHSAATEAVGYGKVAMGFHMLRLRFGDDVFRAALQRFYREQRGKKASFADVRAAFEATTSVDLSDFFEQWVERTGAPDLELADVTVEQSDAGYTVKGSLLQLQKGEAYDIQVPLYLTTASGVQVNRLDLQSRSSRFSLQVPEPPLLLELDPEFDLFRLLDPRETAPSIGQIFGEDRILAVLPAAAAPALQGQYRALAEGWATPGHQIEVVLDSELSELPADRAAWLFGRDNRHALQLFGRDAAVDVDLAADGLLIGGESLPWANHSAVIVRRHPQDVTKALGWIVVDPAAAFPGMASKLPHYGKYSYLGFAGDEPANMLKGEWAATDSPLRVDLRTGDPRFAPALPDVKPPAREALAQLPSVFSPERMMQHIETLAGEAMAGRGLGTPGLELAADYIAEVFAEIGLEPAGDDGSYSQYFPVAEGEDGQPHTVRNILGMLPGSDPAMQEQMLLVTAHYDHLGSGWPDERAEAGDGIYYGADDNASGVAVLLELARTLKAEAQLPRNILFVAFTGEEAGLLGSKYFVENPQPLNLNSINAVVNMDTVGRLGDKPISVFGGYSATEWQHIFRGVGFTTGIASRLIPTELAGSDQESFIQAGIPGVQISSGASLDYHRPTDTVDKIDVDGVLKVAAFVKETVGYLAQRPEPLTAVAPSATAAPAASAGGDGADRRRVSVGTVPDFAFTGNGVRIEGVVPGSPAEQAGMQAGDVLVELADQPVNGLQGYTDLLKQLQPGQVIALVFERDGERFRREVELVAR